MKIAVLGTGMVGEAIATKLISLGHHVCMGSRTADNPAAAAWVKSAGAHASQSDFAGAVAKSEVIFICTRGDATLTLVQGVGAGVFADRIVIDVSNPLDFSRGFPPSLLIVNTNSLGEEVQRALPAARVIKTLNMVNCDVMVDPAKSGGQPTMFLCGNDAGAKQQVTGLLAAFGWADIIDLGDIAAARGTEMMLPVWLSLSRAVGTYHFGFKVVRS